MLFVSLSLSVQFCSEMIIYHSCHKNRRYVGFLLKCLENFKRYQLCKLFIHLLHTKKVQQYKSNYLVDIFVRRYLHTIGQHIILYIMNNCDFYLFHVHLSIHIFNWLIESSAWSNENRLQHILYVLPVSLSNDWFFDFILHASWEICILFDFEFINSSTWASTGFDIHVYISISIYLFMKLWNCVWIENASALTATAQCNLRVHNNELSTTGPGCGTERCMFCL